MGAKVSNVDQQNWWRYEWFELYNNTNLTIALDGWKLESSNWTIGLKGEILPGEYFLDVSSDKIFPLFDQNYSNLSGGFSNNGLKLALKDPLGIIIDEIDCSNEWFAGDNSQKLTMERMNPLLSGSSKDNWGQSKSPNGTPGLKNDTEKTPPANTMSGAAISSLVEGVVISELLPSPKGADQEEEWIEIFNKNDSAVNISSWKISDKAGAIRTYIFPSGTKIEANGFLVLKRPETKIVLNDDGDGLVLMRLNGSVADEVSYEKAQSDQSYNRAGDSWFWSDSKTPFSENTAPEIKNATENSSPSKEKFLASVKDPVQKSTSFFIFLEAFVLALFCGAGILYLKKLQQNKNLL